MRCPDCREVLVHDGGETILACPNGHHWVPGALRYEDFSRYDPKPSHRCAIAQPVSPKGDTGCGTGKGREYGGAVVPLRPSAPEPNGHQALPAGAVAVSFSLADVRPERVQWLWHGRIPRGKFTTVDGDPGLGKSTELLDLAARISRGDVMPDGSRGDLEGPAGVVIMQAEDGWADTIAPRLIAAGADLARVRAFSAIREPEVRDGKDRVSKPSRERLPTLADVAQLEALIAEVEAALVIVDPLVAFLPSGVDTAKDAEVREALAPLTGLGERTRCAIVGIRHLNKAQALQALYRGGGSIGIIGAARSGLLVAADPDEPQRRVLASLKCNLAVTPPSLAFRLESADNGAARVVWEGVTPRTAAQLLEVADQDERRSGTEAEELLKASLFGTEVSAKDLLRAAKDQGIATRTLQRAAESLRIRKRRQGFGKGSEVYWSLADSSIDAIGAIDATPHEVACIGAYGPGTAAEPPAPLEPLRVKCPDCGGDLDLAGDCAVRCTQVV